MAENFLLVYPHAGQQLTRQFDQARVLIGRSVLCDVVIDSAELSRKHAEILRDGDGWSLHDLDSRNGSAVNGTRVALQRLEHGDRIMLAPQADEPVLMEFRMQSQPTAKHSQGMLRDDLGRTSVVASIDLRELAQSLTVSRRAKLAAGTPHVVASDVISGRPVQIDAPGQNDSRLHLPVLSLFKSAGEVLAASENLDDMLQQVVNLIVHHLSGRRGVICLYDAETGEIEPRYFGHETVSVASPSSPVGQESGSSTQPFLVSRSILQEAIRVRRAMLVASTVDDPRFDSALSVHQMGIHAAVCVPLYHDGSVKGLIYVDSQSMAGPLGSRDLEVLTVLGLMVASGITQLSLRHDVARERTMRSRLARYNSPQVVDQIMHSAQRHEDEMLAGEYEVSILFADITGFMSMSENWTAAEVVQVLNLVFERLTATVFERDGTLDKYIGDAVMAVFGAPLRQADHAVRAVTTALEMQRTLDEFNRSRPDNPGLQMRIGINSGRVIAGDIGSPLRKAYTVIGDPVNVASRLETSIAKPGQIIIGPATFAQVSDKFACEPLPEVTLRGKRQTIRPYRVIGREDGGST